MHEYSLAHALLHQVEEIVRREDAASVRGIRVTVGEFSGIEADLLQLAFEQVSQHSLAMNAELLIEKTPLEACCETCSNEFLVERFRFVCPRCEGSRVRVIRGDELIFEQVVLEAK